MSIELKIGFVKEYFDSCPPVTWLAAWLIILDGSRYISNPSWKVTGVWRCFESCTAKVRLLVRLGRRLDVHRPGKFD